VDLKDIKAIIDLMKKKRHFEFGSSAKTLRLSSSEGR
jgi:hypothetical protein